MAETCRRQTTYGTIDRWSLEKHPPFGHPVRQNRLPSELHSSFVLLVRVVIGVEVGRGDQLHGSLWLTVGYLLTLSERGVGGGREEVVWTGSLTPSPCWSVSRKSVLSDSYLKQKD